MAKEFDDLSFINDESGIEEVKDTENDMLVISKDDFIKRTSRVSQQMLEDLEEQAKTRGTSIPPMAMMSEMLTHVALLGSITRELFKEGE